MPLTLRVNSLARTDHGQSSTENVVDAVAHGKLTLLRDQDSGAWAIHDDDQHRSDEEESITTLRDLNRRLRTVLDDAAHAPAGLLSITLLGQRLFTVPRHHWPVVQVADEHRG